jgi:ABC-type Fe3+-hydroxamate transport system substrate-binding protein
MPSVTDALNRTISLQQRPRRIVSLVPSVTESLAELGCAESLVAVTTFCARPDSVVAPLRKIGGTKNPDVEMIAELRPDLVIANKEENRSEDVEALIDAGLTVYVGYPRTAREAINELENLAALATVAPNSARVVSTVRDAIEREETLNATRPVVRVFCPIWRNPYMAVGGETFAGDLLRLAGGVNVFESHPSGGRYPQVTVEEIVAAAPDIVLLPNEPYRFTQRHRDELLALRGVPAVSAERVFLIDGQLITWHGPRIGEALREIEQLLDTARPEWEPPAESSTADSGGHSAVRRGAARATKQPPPNQNKPAPPVSTDLPPGLRFQVKTQDVVDDSAP